MKKVKYVMIVLLSVIFTGCSNGNSEQQEDSRIQGEEQYADNENDSITYDEYSGYWSYEGKTHEQILAEGGIELSCTITGDDQFSGTLFSQQGITQRFASIEDINGKIEQSELYFDYPDDEWGNSGTLHIQFWGDSIYVEILNYKKADNGSDYGINGSFELIREKEDEEELNANDNMPNMDNAAENYETLNTDDITESHEATNEKTDMYDHVLEEYRDMVQNDFYTDLLDSDTYDSSFGEHIGLEIRTHKKAVFYAFYDIDGNGTKELIIAGGEDGVGVANPAFSPCNYDIYGYDGTNVFHIFPEMEFGYRTNFSLYENGIIEVYYSYSAAESGVDFYKIGSDGFTPELVDSFSAVWHLEGEESVCTYYQKANEITEEEYKTNMQNYEVTLTAGLDWIEIY